MSCTSETSITWRVILLLAIGTVCCVDAKWWNDTGFYRLEINEKCNDNGSVTLEFQQLGENKLHVYALTEDSEFSSKINCIREMKSTDKNALLDTECQISANQFRLYIFLIKKGYKIVTSSDMLPKYYIYNVDCNDKTSPNVSVSTDPKLIPVSFPKKISIGNHNFIAKTTFNGKFTNGTLGDAVKIEIDITNVNLFGKSSHLTNCQLEFNSNDQDPIMIVKDSCLQPDYKKIEFKSKFTRATESESAKYTLEFKAFANCFLHPLKLHCQACSDCDDVDCP